MVSNPPCRRCGHTLTQEHRCYALMRIGCGLTVEDLLTLDMPQVAPEHRWMALWEFTGWPAFFAETTHEHWLTILRRQLREFREGRTIVY